MALSTTGAVVLAGSPVIWPGRQSQVSPVCDGNLQGPAAGVLGPGGDERSPEVPDSPWRSLHRSTTLRSHLVSLSGRERVKWLLHVPVVVVLKLIKWQVSHDSVQRVTFAKSENHVAKFYDMLPNFNFIVLDILGPCFVTCTQEV